MNLYDIIESIKSNKPVDKENMQLWHWTDFGFLINTLSLI